MGEVLCGWFVIPDTMEQPLDVTINPIGTRLRSEPRVWNNGQQRLKLVCPGTRMHARACAHGHAPTTICHAIFVITWTELHCLPPCI